MSKSLKIYSYPYPRPSVTCDIVVIAGEEPPSILLIQRKDDPYKNMWALPGGFVDENEDLKETALRELKEEAGLSGITVRQTGAYGQPERDPRGHTVTIAWLAQVEKPLKAVAGDDAQNAEWFPLNELPELAFDHATIIEDALKLI